MKIVVNMPKKPYNLDELMFALEKAKPLPVVINKVLDKISKEIDGLHQKPVGFENEYEGGCNHAVDSVLDIIEKYKGVSE